MINMVICGLGYISERVAKGCQFAETMHLYGFLSSSKEKALVYQKKFGADQIYTSYEEVYRDNHVDVLYLSTPNHVHYEQIMEALKHYKHVICEKPMVASKEEVKALFAYARKQHCFLMEAEKTFFSPLLEKVKWMIENGAIGDFYAISAEYQYDIRKMKYQKNHWVFQKNGGSALDVGVYPICFAHYFANSPIKEHYCVKKNYEDYHCDFYFQSLIRYQNGICANVKSSWLQEVENKGYGFLYGTKGYFEIPAYWKGNRAILYQGETKQEIVVDMQSDFTGEIEHAAMCIASGCWESPLLNEAMSIAILDVME